MTIIEVAQKLEQGKRITHGIWSDGDYLKYESVGRVYKHNDDGKKEYTFSFFDLITTDWREV